MLFTTYFRVFNDTRLRYFNTLLCYLQHTFMCLMVAKLIN
jgi:hypothetical protein